MTRGALGALAFVLLGACKPPVEQGPVIVDVQLVVAGATPAQLEPLAEQLTAALASAGHGRRVHVIAQLGQLDVEVRYDRAVAAAALTEVHALVDALALEGPSPTYVLGTYEQPPDRIVHVASEGAAGARAALARSAVVPVIAAARGVARVAALGAAPAHWGLVIDGEQARARGVTVVEVVAALAAARATHGSIAAPDGLADVVIPYGPDRVPLLDVARIVAVAGDPEGTVDLAVWLGPEQGPGGVEDAITQGAQQFAAHGLVVTEGRAPGHSPPKPGDVEISIITKPAPGLHGNLLTVATELATSHLVGTMVQQPPGRDPRAFSLAMDGPGAARARRAELDAFVRAANGAPLLTIAGRDLLLGPVQDLASVQLANPAGGSVPLAWAVQHDLVPPSIRIYGQPALVFRTRLLPGTTLADVTAFVAQRTDLARFATVEIRALDTPRKGT